MGYTLVRSQTNCSLFLLQTTWSFISSHIPYFNLLYSLFLVFHLSCIPSITSNLSQDFIIISNSLRHSSFHTVIVFITIIKCVGISPSCHFSLYHHHHWRDLILHCGRRTQRMVFPPLQIIAHTGHCCFKYYLQNIFIISFLILHCISNYVSLSRKVTHFLHRRCNTPWLYLFQ